MSSAWIGLILALRVFAADKPPALDLNDFSNTNSVTLLLAEAVRGRPLPGQGLQHIYWERDGQTAVISVESTPCRCLSFPDQRYAKGYLYFAIDPTFKSHDLSHLRFDVEYFDGFEGREGVFGLQYDATGEEPSRGMSSKPAYPNVPLRGSGKWLKTSFHVSGGTYQNSGNGRADFRLWASPPELCVSRVSVTLESPQDKPVAVPLAFDAAGEATLRDWNLQWDSGAKPAFARIKPAEPEGLRWLEIRAPGELAVGSWRSCVLLAPGAYRFMGRVLTKGMSSDGEPSEGAALRVGGRGASSRVREVSQGTTLSYDFVVPTLDYAELVCEFRSEQGSARFDLDSLRLIRRSRSSPQ